MKEAQIVCYDKKNPTPRMKFIDYGLGLFRPEVFATLPQGQACDLADIYQDLVKKRLLSAYQVNERFYEVGSFEGLRELDDLLSKAPAQFLRKE
jgi:NDP-sugar pyrophosphorylase family protein